jgi:A118 family predicted phage portal protein
MFENITNWLKGVMNKMLGKDKIKNATGQTVAVSEEMTNALKLWCEIYEGKEPWQNSKIKSLRLGKTIPNKIARTALVEFKSEIKGSPRADYLNECYKPLKEKLKANLSSAIAKGGMVLKPYVSDGKIKIEIVQAENFYPTKYKDGEITAAVFVERITKGELTYTRLEQHEYENNTAYIKNAAYVTKTKSAELGNKIPLNVVEEWSGLTEEGGIKNIKTPLFVYFKNTTTNTIDPNSPLGCSIYADAIDLLQDADEQWYNLKWENKSGRRKVYVDAQAFRQGEDLAPELPDVDLYQTLETSDPEFYQEWSPQIRYSEIYNSLQAILRQIEFALDLSYGVISDPQSIDKTATEVKQAKQNFFITITDTQEALQGALEKTVYIMDVLTTLYNLAPKGAYEVSYEWGDSVVSDRQNEMEERRSLQSDGVLSKAENRAWYLGITLEEAEKTLPKEPEIDFGGGL